MFRSVVVVGAALVAAALLASCSAGPSHSAAAKCREVVHAGGMACVPADPRRIVTLDSLTVLPTLLELGEPVVGALRVYKTGQAFPEFLPAERTAGLELVGDMQTPDLERIAALAPDLIIGTTPLVEPIQAELERIAPTVSVRYAVYEPDWTADVRLVGDTVNRRADIDTRLAELATKAEQTKAALAGGTRPTLSRVDVFRGAPLYYAFGCTWIGSVLGSAGITQPAGQVSQCAAGDAGRALTTLSPEQLAVLDADAIVAYQQQASAGELGTSPLTELERSPLWAQLAAVRDNRVFVLGDAWGLGGSIPAAEQVLTDLREAVFAERIAGT